MAEARITVEAALEALAKRREDQVVVSTMTVLGPWRERGESDRDLICVGFMGRRFDVRAGRAVGAPGGARVDPRR